MCCAVHRSEIKFARKNGGNSDIVEQLQKHKQISLFPYPIYTSVGWHIYGKYCVWPNFPLAMRFCWKTEVRCQYIRMLHLKLGTAIGATFVFQGETAQNTEREEENRTAYTQTSVIIFQYANSTCWTAIDYDDFGWDSDRRLTDSPIADWNGTAWFRHNDFGRSMRTGLCRVNWCKASSWNGIWMEYQSRTSWKDNKSIKSRSFCWHSSISHANRWNALIRDCLRWLTVIDIE